MRTDIKSPRNFRSISTNFPHPEGISTWRGTKVGSSTVGIVPTSAS